MVSLNCIDFRAMFAHWRRSASFIQGEAGRSSTRRPRKRRSTCTTKTGCRPLVQRIARSIETETDKGAVCVS